MRIFQKVMNDKGPDPDGLRDCRESVIQANSSSATGASLESEVRNELKRAFRNRHDYIHSGGTATKRAREAERPKLESAEKEDAFFLSHKSAKFLLRRLTSCGPNEVTTGARIRLPVERDLDLAELQLMVPE